MSWDSSERTYLIYGDTSKKEEVYKYVEELKKSLENQIELIKDEEEFDFKTEYENIICYVIEQGMYKYGFSGCINDEHKFIKEIIMIDKENIKVLVRDDGWAETDSYIHYYENGKIRFISETQEKFNKIDDEKEIIEKLKKDFNYFEALSQEERQRFDYQMASLEAGYPSYTWEFGTEGLDELYSEEFLKQEETLRAMFKYGTRRELLIKKVLPRFKNNKKLIKEVLLTNPHYIKYLPDEYKKDRDLILSLLYNSKQSDFYYDFNISDVDIKFRNDKKIVLNFMKIDTNTIGKITSRLKNDYDICKMAVTKGELFSLANIRNKDVLNDKELMIKLLTRDYVTNTLYTMPEYLKNERKVIIKILFKTSEDKMKELSLKEIFIKAYKEVEYPYQLFELIPYSLLKDDNFIDEMIAISKKRSKKDYCKFKVYATKEILNDNQLLEKLRKKKIEIEYFSHLIDTKELALKNLKNIYLGDLNKELKNDKELQKEYVLKDGRYDFLDISNDLLKDKKLRKKCFERVYSIHEDILDEDFKVEKVDRYEQYQYNQYMKLKEVTDFNKEDLMALSKTNPLLIKKYGMKYIDDKKFALIAIKGGCDIYQNLNDELKNDRDIIKADIISSWSVDINKYSEETRKDKELMLLAVKSNNQTYNLLNEDLKADEDIINLVKNNITCFKYLPKKYSENKEIFMKLLKKLLDRKSSFFWIQDNLKKWTPPAFLDDEEFIEFLCKIKTEYGEPNTLYTFASERILSDINIMRRIFKSNENLSLEEMYIEQIKKDKIYDWYPECMNTSVQYYKQYIVNCRMINSVYDLRECSTLEDALIEMITRMENEEGDFLNLYNVSLILPESILKNRKLLINILNKKTNLNLVNKYCIEDRDKIYELYKDDEEVMKLYNYEEKRKRMIKKKEEIDKIREENQKRLENITRDEPAEVEEQEDEDRFLSFDDLHHDENIEKLLDKLLDINDFDDSDVIEEDKIYTGKSKYIFYDEDLPF